MLTIALITAATARHYRVPRRVMVDPARPREYSRPRQVAMFLARHMTRHSRAYIGQHFGGRDPSTIYHAEQAVEARRQTDPALDRDVRLLLLDLLAPEAELADEPDAFTVIAGQPIRRDALPSFPRAGAM